MKVFFILSFLMIKMYFSDSENSEAARETSRISGHYQIIETSLPEIWSKRLFQLSQDTTTADEKKYVLTGFTNHGVNVQGILCYPDIQFPRQSAKVIPEGGDGKAHWTIDMDANGIFHQHILELNYRIFQPDSTILSGKIRAEKIEP
jgi:hypothetical protein